MSRRRSKAEVLVVQLVDRDKQPLRPLPKGQQLAAVIESAQLPLLPLDQALAWSAHFNRGEIARPMGAWAIVRRVRVNDDGATAVDQSSNSKNRD
jgi:hypothetical protein